MPRTRQERVMHTLNEIEGLPLVVKENHKSGNLGIVGEGAATMRRLAMEKLIKHMVGGEEEAKQGRFRIVQSLEEDGKWQVWDCEERMFLSRPVDYAQAEELRGQDRERAGMLARIHSDDRRQTIPGYPVVTSGERFSVVESTEEPGKFRSWDSKEEVFTSPSVDEATAERCCERDAAQARRVAKHRAEAEERNAAAAAKQTAMARVSGVREYIDDVSDVEVITADGHKVRIIAINKVTGVLQIVSGRPTGRTTGKPRAAAGAAARARHNEEEGGR